MALTGSPRADFFVTMVHADALLQAKNLDKACAVARAALDAGTQLKSARCAQYVRRFREALDEKAHGARAAVELAEYAAGHPLWVRGSAA
jgi:hypothetical protein